MLRRAWILAVVLAAPGTPALAQGGGVVVDPSSPTGKEYAIPLESARQIGSDKQTDAARPQYQRSAPLFGEGVGDDTAASTTARKSSGRHRRITGSRPQTKSRSRTQPDTASVTANRTSVRDPQVVSEAGTDLLPLGGGALLVLIAGAAGIVLRQARR